MKRFFLSFLAAVYCLFITPVYGDEARGAAHSLQETLKTLDAKLYWDSFFQSGIFSMDGHNLAFQTGVPGEYDYVLYDHNELIRLPLPYIENGKIKFPAEFVSGVRRAFEDSKRNDESHFKIAAIMVDPGHGGKDTGATGMHNINGKKIELIEKNITLNVANELWKRLKSAFPSKKILITRTGDTYPTLQTRVAMANSVELKDNEAIIYISVHANASFNKTARGFEVWYLNPDHNRTVLDKKTATEYQEIVPILNDILQEEYNRESLQMAAMIHKRIAETFGKRLPSRGLKAEDFFVVRKTLMPSVLVELAFVTNEEDAQLLSSREDLNKFADAITAGILDFVKSFERTGGYIASP